MKDRIKIQAWDKDLFNYLYANKISTLEQISRDLPKYNSKSSYIWRLWKLKKLGYLTGQYNEDHDGTNIYRVTKETYRKYLSRGAEPQIVLGSNAVPHDLDLVDIKSIISKSKKVRNYYTENMIQSWIDGNYKNLTPFKKLNADAAINVNVSDDNFWFGLEYEASVKSQKRYDELFSNFYFEDDIVAILYICKSKSIMKDLKKSESNIAGNNTKKIYYTTLDSLLDNNLVFENLDGMTIDLND